MQRSISPAPTAATPVPASWKPPVAKPAATEVVAAGHAHITVLRQAAVRARLGSSKGCGWAHAAIEKHQSGQPVCGTDALTAGVPSRRSIRQALEECKAINFMG